MLIKRTISIIEAPSNLGLVPPAPGKVPGVSKAPEALRAAQLGQRLFAQDAGRLEAPVYRPEIEPETGIRNSAAIRGYSVRLAELIAREVRRDRFVLVVGGDCSILLGTQLGLRQVGRYGLVFLDAHSDFHIPQTSRTGSAAGMDLALAVGRGPDLLTNIGGLKPYVRESDVFLVGNRDVGDPNRYPAPHLFQSQVQMIPLEKVRKVGISSVSTQILQRFEESAVAGFFVHFDLDVLDPSIMPAVDTPMPNGMTYQEMSRLFRGLFASDLLVGMSITLYDPERDPDGTVARTFVKALTDTLQVVNG